MLIIFDVEGVLLNAEYLPVLGQLLGPEKEREIWAITKQGIRGEINWEEGLKRRVQALRGIKYDDAKRIGESLEIMNGAKELCTALKKAFQCGTACYAIASALELRSSMPSRLR